MTDILSAPAAIAIRPLAGNIGAELGAVTPPPTSATRPWARSARRCCVHKVVFLRDQHLDYDSQVAFAQRLGSLTLGHPTLASPPGQPFLEEIDSRQGGAGELLAHRRDVRGPAAGVHAAAGRGHPAGRRRHDLGQHGHRLREPAPDLRDLADRLRIVHTNAYDYAATAGRAERTTDAAGPAPRSSSPASTRPSTRRSACTPRPASGRCCSAGSRARWPAFSPQAGRDLIRILQEYVTRPEHTVRWQWRAGDLAIWDNRATQHYAVFDYGSRAPPRRARHRGRPGSRSAWTGGPAWPSPARPRPTTPAARPDPGTATPEGGIMSTSADVSASRRKPVPVYKRKRRRIYGAVAAALPCRRGRGLGRDPRGGSAAGPLPSFTIAYGQGTVANSDSILDSGPALAKTIPAKLRFVPFDAGVTAIAEMRSGSLQAISGVGNPPVVGAIGTGSRDVVIAQSFDADALIVPASVTTAAQLAGKKVGVLVGSSEDYELRGWLGLEHLTSKVTVVGFASEQAAAAAYLGGSVSAAYVQAGPEAQLGRPGRPPAHQRRADRQARHPRPERGGRVAAAGQVRPGVVQKYVCAEVAATRRLTGPQSAKYLTQSARAQGVPGSSIVAATRAFPFIPLSQQLHWLGATASDTSSPIVRAYVQTGQFLVGQGRLTSAPPPRPSPRTWTRRSSRRPWPVTARRQRGPRPRAAGPPQPGPAWPARPPATSSPTAWARPSAGRPPDGGLR